MLASDANNSNFTGAHDPDAVMVARFYVKAVRNNFLSKQESRPIFEDKIYCEYYPAGSTLLRMDVPAQEAHKVRFAKQWAYFQSQQKGDARDIGTPLSQWPILSPADIENLRGMKFHTVENIAGASDQQLQALGMGMAGMAPHVLRARAQAYLGAASDTALPQRQAEEIEKLRERDAQREKELAELRAMVNAQVEAKKGKRKMTEEERKAVGERLAKGRAAKKEQNAINAPVDS